MTSEATPTSESRAPIGSAGFDAPITSREADHLNRWPLARQVYSVAVDGPAEWSARIGVYGEWGTGKSSVLKFVESMATADHHVVVWFNPWAYSTKAELWRAFVMEISSKIEPEDSEGRSSGMRDWKARFSTWRDWLAGTAKEATGDISGGVSVALEAVRGLFAFSAKDVADLREQLGGKRVVILIDDLDRTSAELVPEILFALKAIMDVPGFSFICGFDPKVVGEVLRTKHPGFGDGLKFLEKIIDYPVWLPSSSDDGLKRIAEADAAKYCSFIKPTAALHDALDLLPKNPRSIRQFVRICALLKTQAERHGKDELNWPIILTSNVIKIRFPMLDPGVLHSHEFYRGIGMRRSFESSTQEGAKVDQEIVAHADLCLKQAGVEDPQGESKAWLQRAIRRICQHLDLWMGEGVAGVIYQSTLAERPRALTKHEFDQLWPIWRNKKSIREIGARITAHCDSHGILATETASDLAVLLMHHLKQHLRAADGAFTDRERTSHRSQSMKAITFFEELVLRPTGFHKDLEIRNWIPLEVLLAELVPLVEAKSPIHQEAWRKIESLLIRLVKGWDARFETLLDAVRSLGRHGRRWIEGASATVVAASLNALVDDQLSHHLIDGIQEDEFIGRIAYHRTRTREMRRLMTNPESRFWTAHSDDVVAAFSKPKPTPAARGNAYALLEWIEHLLGDHQHGDANAGQAMARNNALMQAVWRAATYKPFLGAHVHRIRDIPDKLGQFGTSLVLPVWWQPAIDEYLHSFDQVTETKSESGGQKESGES